MLIVETHLLHVSVEGGDRPTVPIQKAQPSSTICLFVLAASYAHA